MKTSKIILLIITLMLLLAYNNYAQNFNDALRLSDMGLGSSARALGMGNAYSALSDDYSAASFNPAGFGLLKRMEFGGGINYSNFGNNTTFYNNQSDYSNSITKLNQFSFAFPFPTIRGSFVLAAGYSRDRDFNQAIKFNGFNPTNTSMIQSSLTDDLDNNIPYQVYLTNDDGVSTVINGRLNQEGTILTNGGLGKWAFSGALEVAKDLFVGATFNIISGTMKRTREYYEDDVNNIYGSNIQTVPGDEATSDFQTFYFNDIIDWEVSGWDAKVGFIYQSRVSDYSRLRFGGSIKFPTSYTIKETYTVNGRSEFGTGKISKYGIDYDPIEYDVSSPFIFNGGASITVKGLIVSSDVSYVDYTQMEFNSGLSSEDITINNREIKDLFRGVFNINAGAEYTFPVAGLRLRGGFILNPSPYKNDPSERDRKYVTGGLGFLVDETVAIDAAYAYGWWKDIGENYGSNVSLFNQDVTYSNFILTFSYRF